MKNSALNISNFSNNLCGWLKTTGCVLSFSFAFVGGLGAGPFPDNDGGGGCDGTGVTDDDDTWMGEDAIERQLATPAGTDDDDDDSVDEAGGVDVGGGEQERS